MIELRVGHLVERALADVEAALGAVAAAQGVPWHSPAGPRYRAALDDVQGRLRATRSAVVAAAHPASVLDAAAGRPWLAPVVRPVLGGLVP